MKNVYASLTALSEILNCCFRFVLVTLAFEEIFCKSRRNTVRHAAVTDFSLSILFWRLSIVAIKRTGPRTDENNSNFTCVIPERKHMCYHMSATGKGRKLFPYWSPMLTVNDPLERYPLNNTLWSSFDPLGLCQRNFLIRRLSVSTTMYRRRESRGSFCI